MADLFLALFFISFVGLIVGLVKPSIFTRITKREISRKQIGLFFSGALVLFLVLTGITAKRKEPTPTPTTEQEKAEAIPKVESKVEADKLEPETTNQVKPTPKPTPKPKPKPTPKPTPEPESEAEATLGEKNALEKAINYLNYSAFSRDGLIKQLEFDGFTHQQAVYGADNCGADWNKQAVRKAKDYLNYSAFSRDGLIKQLEFDGFTHQQAVYGAEGVGY